MIVVYSKFVQYEFKNSFIEKEFENKKEYYYLGFQSIEYLITKNIYNYLLDSNSNIGFCCDFSLLQKIIKRITSKEYFKKIFNDVDEKYIYSFVGAVILDNSIVVEELIAKMYRIESFLLTIYKKEDNKYLLVDKFIKAKQYNITTTFSFLENVECVCYIEELNRYFSNSSKSMLNAKYSVLEEIYEFLIDNKLYYDLNDLISGYSVDSSVHFLEVLHEKKIISNPEYFYIVHDQFEETKYEVQCRIKGLSFYSIKIHNTKEEAKNLAAFSMLEMIVIQNNT